MCQRFASFVAASITHLSEWHEVCARVSVLDSLFIFEGVWASLYECVKYKLISFLYVIFCLPFVALTFFICTRDQWWVSRYLYMSKMKFIYTFLSWCLKFILCSILFHCAEFTRWTITAILFAYEDIYRKFEII